jgi:chromosome segregation ATPase
MNQHKLLQRIDGLKAELQEAQEAVRRHQGGTAAKEELVNAAARAAELEERLNTQAELIQSLEADLKTARLSQKAAESKPAETRSGRTQEVEKLKELEAKHLTQAELIQSLEAELKAARLAQKAADSKAADIKSGRTQEVEKLTKELEAKNQTIAELQVYADEQQKKVARLRSSESETVRLKALTEKGRGEIEQLTTEVTQLKEALASAPPPDEHADLQSKVAALEAKLKEREVGVARLVATIKEHEATIKKLTESSESWKRKYQFLASDQPDAYKNAAET